MAIDTNVTAPVNVIGAPVTNTVANHAEKPKKFNGQNFKRWQKKMFFYLTTLNLARFLNETAPQVEPSTEGQPSNAHDVLAMKAWKHSNFLCHNYVLNGLVDDLYNVYCKTTTAIELWESLERKYKTKDAGKKNNDKKSKGKAEYLAPKAGIMKQKFQRTWYNCDQPGHRAANCKMPKRMNPHQDNMVNDNVNMIAMVSDVIAMISEVNLSGKFVLSKNQMYVGKGYDVNDEAIDNQTKVENQLGQKIMVVRSDRGGEYVSSFADVYTKHGIRHEFTALYSPQQNV
nr:uncharacterized protein [Tanacetum cinerariifolium]